MITKKQRIYTVIFMVVYGVLSVMLYYAGTFETLFMANVIGYEALVDLNCLYAGISAIIAPCVIANGALICFSMGSAYVQYSRPEYKE